MRYVIIGQKDSNQLLVVDTQLMTVTPLDQQTVVPETIQSAISHGDTLVDGVNIAVAAGQREDGSAAWFYASK